MDESYGKRRQVEEILEWYNQNKKDRNFGKEDVTFYDDLYEVVTDLRKWGVNCKLVDWQTGVKMSDIVESWAVETPQMQSSVTDSDEKRAGAVDDQKAPSLDKIPKLLPSI
ncbi:hypothetical protein HDU85_006424 [Gaertneriomyces sp. JEL0708]|nr:hypothetical protein HDU85_006424 [Gaertneriomyces sp. JEL0708]